MTSYPIGSKPRIQWDHVDGPLLICSDGTPHWLTWKERISLRLRLITIATLNERWALSMRCMRVCKERYSAHEREHGEEVPNE